MKYSVLAFCLCFGPLAAWAVGFLAFINPLKTARTSNQKTLYVLNIILSPIIIPSLFIIKIVGVIIKLALLAIVLAIVPVIGLIIYINYNLLPVIGNFFSKFTGGFTRRIFSFMMSTPMDPFRQIDASLDTLASSTWRFLIRNPIDEVIQRRETKWVMGWWGRREGRVSYLLALARDPELETGRRSSAITELGAIAAEERARNFTPENMLPKQTQTATSQRLRELACDRAVSTPARLVAATTLLERSFRGEARQAFWDMAQDANITDQLTRVQIAQGLSGLGQAACSQAVNMLLAILADNQAPLDVRFESAKTVAPLCNTLTTAGKITPILKQWSSRNSSPQIRLQVARIFAILFQRHQNNPAGLAQTFQWDQRAGQLAVSLVTQQTSQQDIQFAVQAIRILGDLGDIDRLISLRDKCNMNYPSRSEIARMLESLGQIEDGSRIWYDLAQQTNRLIVTPSQRVKAAAAAGLYGYWRETKEILQSIAQSTCIEEPLTCLDAAAELRRLGWYQEAMSFVMVLDKNHLDKPEIAKMVDEAMRWRDL